MDVSTQSLKKPSYLVLCPLKKETQLLLEAFKKLNFEIVSDRIENQAVHFIDKLNLYISTGGHGKVQFAIRTQFFLAKGFGASGVICVGAGGGLSQDLNPGDLVVAEKTLEHDYREVFNSKSKRPEIYGCTSLIAKAKNIKNENFKIYFGIIASGDEDIADAERALELYKSTEALAVAWEGIGAAKACDFNNKPFLEIRGITDNARDSVAEAFFKNLPTAMNHAAWLITKLI